MKSHDVTAPPRHDRDGAVLLLVLGFEVERSNEVSKAAPVQSTWEDRGGRCFIYDFSSCCGYTVFFGLP